MLLVATGGITTSPVAVVPFAHFFIIAIGFIKDILSP
jgi:hypothetical protein